METAWSQKLKELIISRRDKLKSASEEFYELINETADIHGSDKNEEIVIHSGKNEMSIDVFKIKKTEADHRYLFTEEFLTPTLQMA